MLTSFVRNVKIDFSGKIIVIRLIPLICFSPAILHERALAVEGQRRGSGAERSGDCFRCVGAVRSVPECPFSFGLAAPQAVKDAPHTIGFST